MTSGWKSPFRLELHRGVDEQHAGGGRLPQGRAALRPQLSEGEISRGDLRGILKGNLGSWVQNLTVGSQVEDRRCKISQENLRWKSHKEFSVENPTRKSHDVLFAKKSHREISNGESQVQNLTWKSQMKISYGKSQIYEWRTSTYAKWIHMHTYTLW